MVVSRQCGFPSSLDHAPQSIVQCAGPKILRPLKNIEKKEKKYFWSLIFFSFIHRVLALIIVRTRRLESRTPVVEIISVHASLNWKLYLEIGPNTVRTVRIRIIKCVYSFCVKMEMKTNGKKTLTTPVREKNCNFPPASHPHTTEHIECFNWAKVRWSETRMCFIQCKCRQSTINVKYCRRF